MLTKSTPATVRVTGVPFSYFVYKQVNLTPRLVKIFCHFIFINVRRDGRALKLICAKPIGCQSSQRKGRFKHQRSVGRGSPSVGSESPMDQLVSPPFIMRISTEWVHTATVKTTRKWWPAGHNTGTLEAFGSTDRRKGFVVFTLHWSWKKLNKAFWIIWPKPCGLGAFMQIPNGGTITFHKWLVLE